MEEIDGQAFLEFLRENLLNSPENTTIVQDPDTLDCQACGVCCLPDKPEFGDVPWVMIFESDVNRLGRRNAKKYTERDKGMFLGPGQRLPPVDSMPGVGNVKVMSIAKTKRGIPKCLALTGKVGKRVSCAVYEDRPEVCRSVRKGSQACMAYREQYKQVLELASQGIEV
jgi:Fe-S-cluster containining protein